MAHVVGSIYIKPNVRNDEIFLYRLNDKGFDLSVEELVGLRDWLNDKIKTETKYVVEWV